MTLRTYGTQYNGDFESVIPMAVCSCPHQLVSTFLQSSLALFASFGG